MQKLRRMNPIAARAAIIAALAGWLNAAHAAGATAQELTRPTLGPSADVCPSGAPDADGDQVCDAAEATYGTDPAKADTDGDALSDHAELFGMLVEGLNDDGSPTHLDLPALDADPLRRDVFVEIDYFPGRTPRKEALDRVIAAFAAAPLDNPDGSRGITLHLYVDDEIDDPMLAKPQLGQAKDILLQDLLVDVYIDFEPIKLKYASLALMPAFHYAVYANQMVNNKYGGVSFQVNAHDFVLTMGPSPSLEFEAAAFMHELGHNLGLHHGGPFDGENYKPNYLSIMNYSYHDGLLRDGVNTLDFSRHPVAAMSEGWVDEIFAMAPGKGTTEADLARYQVNLPIFGLGTVLLRENASMNLDWNRDGTYAIDTYTYDLNGDGDAHDTFGESKNDWESLTYDGGGTIGRTSWDGAPAVVPSNLPCEFPQFLAADAAE